MADSRNPRPLEERLRDFLKSVSGAPGAPDVARRALELSWELESSGAPGQAFRLLKGILTLAPREACVRFEMVKLLERTGKSEEAVTVFLEGCAGATVEQRLHVATMLISKGRLAEAERILAREPKLPEDDPRVQRAWGRVLRWQHRFREAALAYGRARAGEPRDPQIYLLMAECYLGLGDLDRMFSVLAEGLKACPEPGAGDVQGLLRRYRLAICALDFAQAARIGELVLDRTRAAPDLEWLQWQIFTEDGDFLPRPEPYLSRARRSAEDLLAARPELPWGSYFKLMLTETSPESPADLEGVDELSRFPWKRYGWMRFKAGLLLLHDEDFSRAAREFDAASLAAKPGNWKARVLACECLIHDGRRKEAALALRRLPRLVPSRQGDFGEFWAQRGKLLLWLGRYKEALAALETALQHTSYQAGGWKGAALVKLGRPGEALPVLDRAISLPAFLDQWEARLWRAEALYLLGRRQEAMAECRRTREAMAGDNKPHLRILEGLLGWESGDRTALLRSAARLPPELVGLARERTRIKGDDPAHWAALLRALLSMAGGIRLSSPRTPHHWWSDPVESRVI